MNLQGKIWGTFYLPGKHEKLTIKETTNGEAYKGNYFNLCFQQNFWKQLGHYWRGIPPLASRIWAIFWLLKTPYFVRWH